MAVKLARLSFTAAERAETFRGLKLAHLSFQAAERAETLKGGITMMSRSWRIALEFPLVMDTSRIPPLVLVARL